MAYLKAAYVLAIGVVAFAFEPSGVRADTFISEFVSGFDGWQQAWHKESETGTAGVVAHSTERGYLDGASLHFDMGDGLGDDGTLWIEKQFAVPAGVPAPVSLSFQLFNPFQSDFNTFEVKAAIGANDPDEQADFTTIGSTETAAGWVPFTFEDTVTSPSGQVWVAAGIRVAWESHREYWVDRVAVSTGVIPEPSSGMMAWLALSTVALVRRRRS